MTLSATQLRNRLYEVLHNIAATGEPVEVDLKGTRFTISPAKIKPRRLDALRAHPTAVSGGRDALDSLADAPTWDAATWEAAARKQPPV